MTTHRPPKRSKNKLLLPIAGGVTALCMVCCSCLFISTIFAPPSTETASGSQVVDALPDDSSLPLPPSPIPADTTEPPTGAPTNPPPTDTAPPQPTIFTPGGCIPSTQMTLATVTKIVDGDTIEVAIDGVPYRVRYIGMDTSENTSEVEYYGPEATVKNAELVAGKVVILAKDISETDRYDRLLRYVLVGDVFVNYELVRQGYANAVTYPPDVSCADTFRLAEEEARAAQLGLWAAPTPIPTEPIIPTAPPPPSKSGGGGGSGGGAVCNCSGPDLDCPDFGTHYSAQSCYDYCRDAGYGDVFDLDRDSDGSACETLP